MERKINFINVKMKLGDLVPTSYNPRKLSKKQYDDLEASLKKFKLAELPVINKNTNQILAGHMRIQILTDLYGKEYEIDCRMPEEELSKEDCDEYMIRSNKNTGEWDFEKLKDNFSFEELTSYGFEPYELSFFDGETLKLDNADHLTKSMDSYLNGTARQIVLYFGAKDHEEIVARMEKVLESMGSTSYTEAFIRMLDLYKNK